MKSLLKAAGACVLASAGLGVATSAAFGQAAQTGSAAGLTIPFGQTIDQIVTGPEGGKGVSVGASCPSWASADELGLAFQSGTAVNYKLGSPVGPNANAEGDAMLVDFSTGAPVPTGYEGHAHAWIGNNINPNYSPTGNQQVWNNETVSFDGTATDGTSISISVSAGGGTSATGNQSGWVHIKVSCS